MLKRILFVLINSFAFLTAMDQPKKNPLKRKHDQIIEINDSVTNDKNSKKRKIQNSDLGQNLLLDDLLYSDDLKQIKEIDSEKAKEKKTSDTMVNYFEKNNIKKCLSYIRKRSEIEKKLLFKAILDKYESTLKKVFKSGIYSFLVDHKVESYALNNRLANDISFNDDSTKILTTGEGYTARTDWNDIKETCIWDIKSSEVLWQTQNELEIANFYDSNSLVYKEEHGPFLIKKLDSGDSKIIDFKSEDNKNITNFRYFPRKKLLVYKSENNIRIFNLVNNRWEAKISLKDEIDIIDIEFSLDLKYIVVRKNKVTKIFDLQGNLIKQIDDEYISRELKLPDSYNCYEFLLFFPNKNSIVIPYGNDKYYELGYSCMVIWDFEKDTIKKIDLDFKLEDFDISPDGRLLIGISFDDIYFYDLDKGNQICKLCHGDPDFYAGSISMSKDQNYLGLGSSSDDIAGERVYDRARVLNFSNSWCVNSFDLKQLIFVTKLLNSPESLDLIKNTKYIDYYNKFHYILRENIQTALLPELINNIYKNNNINGTDITNIILQYLNNDLVTLKLMV